MQVKVTASGSRHTSNRSSRAGMTMDGSQALASNSGWREFHLRREVVCRFQKLELTGNAVSLADTVAA